MSKQTKKKRVRDHLAKKRGIKKQKKKTPPPSSKKHIDPEILSKMMLATISLADLEELRDVAFDSQKLDEYLESAKDSLEREPIDFIREGIKFVLSPDFLNNIRNRFISLVEQKKAPEHILFSIDTYFKLLAMGVLPEYIPTHIMLFAKQVKKHPLADDPKIWKYIIDFLPKKVVPPDEKGTIIIPGTEKLESKKEKKEEKRDERYPHIILPK